VTHFDVGQKVRVLPYAYSTGARRTARGLGTDVREGEVVKVARVRVTVRVQGWDIQFDMATGRECVRDFGRTIETEEQFEEREHRQDLLTALRAHGLATSRDISTAKLEDILAIMEGL